MIKHSKKKLDNGLTLLAEQDLSTNLVAVNVMYKVGSKNEDSNRTGIAHLFEHLMFGGSKNAVDFDTIIQNASGESNAFTNSDYTNYYNVVPVENIEIALWLEADRMANLNINTNTLEIQKKVVIEEFKEVCLNKPYGDNWHHLSSMAYKNHPYNWPTIGKEPRHIKESHLDEIKSFYKNYYNPENAILSISGPLKTEQVFQLAEKWFSEIASGSTTPFPFFKEEVQTHQRYKKINTDVPVAQFIGGCHMPGRSHKDYYACDLLTDILANGKSSRLYSNLVRKHKVFTAIDCYVSGTFDPGLIILEGTPSPNNTVEEGLESFWNEIDKLYKSPPDVRELQKVKNKVISSLLMNEMNVLNKAISMAYYESLDALDTMNHQVDFYNETSIDDILNAASKYLTTDKASIVEYAPLETVKTTT